MDDFLTKLYHEELEKNAGAGQRALFDALPASDLEEYLGLSKVAVGGPVQPDLSPAMKKSIEARETKGKDAEKRVAQAHSSSETQPDRNIAPLTPGQEVPERNFVQPGRSIPENTLAVKQASVQWADQMGRALAHMVKQAAEEGIADWAQNPEIEKQVDAAIAKNKAELAKAPGAAKPGAGAAAKGLWKRIPRSAKIGVPAAALVGGALLARHHYKSKEGSSPFAKEGADLSQAQREALPSKSFAVPEKKAKKLGVEHEIQGEAKGKYPIPDEAHARNALARVAQHGTPGEKEAVRAKVHAKFPGIGEGEEKRSCAMGKASDFTSPEAQAKAKVMSRALKTTKGAPPHVRKAAVAVTAKQMRK